jgi:hypothetical protein
MIIFKADFFTIGSDDDYNQKDFLKNLENNFQYFSATLHTHDDYNHYDPCYIFESIDDALDEAANHEAVGVKISKFVLDEDDCKELLISRNLKVPSEKVYYSYNETTQELEEFQLKIFL